MDQKTRLHKLLSEKVEAMKYDRLSRFDPYPFQLKFMSDHSSDVALQAANQIGKSVSGCAWDAYDLTGLYPDWWNGHKFTKPITLVAGCVNNDKTRDVLQRELFGDPVEWEAELGTGWIPKHCIGKIQKKRGVPDAFYNVRIKHHTNGKFDGWSKLVFLAYEMGKATWMGHKADVNHLDEEPPEEILEQAARSGIATGGRIRLTFTPENGVSSVVRSVKEWSLHTAEWKDVAGEDFDIDLDGEIYPFKTVSTLSGKPGHLTKDYVLNAKKKILPYQLKMRMRGIPVMGSGLVFAYPEDSISCDPFLFPEHFKYLDAIDFGGLSTSSHPTAWARIAYDPQNDIIYVYDGLSMIGKEIPEIATHIRMKPNSDRIPSAYPHDGNKMGQGGTTRDQYAAAGVNMCETHVTNPPMDGQVEGKGGIQIMPGITDMSSRMSDGRFKVFSTVYPFFEEYRNYHMKDGKIIDVGDDFISAVRYATIYIRHAVLLKEEKVTLNINPNIGGWMSL